MRARIWWWGFWALAFALHADPGESAPVHYIHTGFENASPLQWLTESNGTVQAHLLYDQERLSPNRAAGHWLFQVQGRKGAQVSLVLTNFDNIWNGRPGSPISGRSHVYLSTDGKAWEILDAFKTTNNTLRVEFAMPADAVYVARLEPYRISDLERFKTEIATHASARVEIIGRTVEGRDLEIIRAGSLDAPYRVFIRARAHPWESGGNWVAQGMIREWLSGPGAANRQRKICLYVMPMANKDGVARGRTRFNSQGMDLNRKWDRPADPQLAPENAALESWLESQIQQGRKPQLALDLHNDNSGKLHLSRPPIPAVEDYLKRMRRFEDLMKKHTWFREGSTGTNFSNPGTIGEGLLTRYGIDAAILELNCDWIEGLGKPPTAGDWERLGRDMVKVFEEFFQDLPK